MFCKECGKQVDDEMKFCDGCGAPLAQNPTENPVNTPPPVYQQNEAPTQQAQVNQQEPPITPPPFNQQEPPNTPPPSSDTNKIIYVLAYLGILFFLPLVVSPVTPTGKFHANQGLLLFITSVAGCIAISILTAIFFAFGFLSWIFNLAILALAIYGMVNAYNEKEIPLPVIGKLFTIIK
jgi:uncharacterized membrane protein